MYRKNSRKNRVACRKANRKVSRKNSRKANRKNSRKNSRKQRGGAMAYGSQEGFGTMLEDNMRAAAGVAPIDKAMADLPQFVGSYGTQTGGSRNSRKNNRRNSRKNRKNSRKASRKNRKNNRKQRGGAFGDNASPVDAPSNLMPKDMYAFSHQNPQFYNENIINPNFNGPSNSYAKN